MTSLLLAVWLLPAAALADDLPTAPFEAPKFGLKAQIPRTWRIVAHEENETVFVAMIPQADAERPGVAACELGLAPENLKEYRTRLEASARRGDRPGTLAKNEIVKTPKGERLESLWEFRPKPGSLWREVSIRIIANRQMYTFTLNVDEATYPKVRPVFDQIVDSTIFTPPNTGADLLDASKNRWVQREFKFALDLPKDWKPALAPDEVALFYANGPPEGIWSDNALVIAQPHRDRDLRAIAESLPQALRQADRNCEVLQCKVISQGNTEALETVVRTQRGPFSMTILERRFAGERFDYEVKFTVETKRYEYLSPTLRKSLNSFSEVPGSVPNIPGGKPA